MINTVNCMSSIATLLLKYAVVFVVFVISPFTFDWTIGIDVHYIYHYIPFVCLGEVDN